MTIASLTSSISMLEVPVSYVVEEHGASRRKAVMVLGLTITAISLLLVFNFNTLFDLAVSLTTEFSQPLLGFFFAVFVGWIWHRNGVLAEIKQGCPDAEQGLFWKIWPFYIRYICPLAILAVYGQTLLG